MAEVTCSSFPLLEMGDTIPLPLVRAYTAAFDAWPDTPEQWARRWCTLGFLDGRAKGIFQYSLQRVDLGPGGWSENAKGRALALTARGTLVLPRSRGHGLGLAMWRHALGEWAPNVVDVATVSGGGHGLVLAAMATPEGRRVRMFAHDRDTP